VRHLGVAAALGITLAACTHATAPVATTRLKPLPTTTSAPVSTAPTKQVDPAATKILQRLEAAGKKYPCITADLHYREVMGQIGDTEERTGWVSYQAETKDSPAKFRIHFKTIRQGDGRPVKNVEDYVFDGEWFTMRKVNTEQHHKLQLPPEEKIEAVELGKGPFPVPFGQKAETVLKHFDVKTRPPVKTDPPKTDYLRLVARPRQERRLDVEWLELWVRADGLPVKIVAEDASKNRKTVEFKNIVTPKSLPKNTFDLPRPPPDWDYQVKRWEGTPKR
jgi:hypothetical protein